MTVLTEREPLADQAGYKPRERDKPNAAPKTVRRETAVLTFKLATSIGGYPTMQGAMVSCADLHANGCCGGMCYAINARLVEWTYIYCLRRTIEPIGINECPVPGEASSALNVA